MLAPLGEAILLNKTLYVTLSLALTAFAGTAVADWSCGDVAGQFPPVALDACHGDTNADNPYAGCDGDWQDLYEANSDTYVQTCNDGATHVWVCPQANPNYSVDGASCQSATV